MKPVYVPNYYPAFKCVAAACRHTCCVGWEIDVDEESLARYTSVEGALGDRLRRGIDREADPPCFILDEAERCPFLNPNGLCDLIAELGEDSLCRICADHPRFRNILPDRVEVGLGLCCEAAAALILGQTQPMEIICLPAGEAARERAADSACDPLDPVTEALLTARDTLFEVAEDRSHPLAERFRHILTSLDIQLPVKSYAEWASFLANLERLDPVWDDCLKALSALPEAPADELDGETAVAYEQIFCYFLYRYVAAEDDGRPALLQVRTAFAILSVILIHAAARATGRMDPESLADIARLYSSEIEYSEENLERFWDEIQDAEM